MSGLLDMLIPIMVGAVAVVLLLGLINLVRRGPANTSQKLMRWRVGLQFIALCLIMVSLYFFRG